MVYLFNFLVWLNVLKDLFICELHREERVDNLTDAVSWDEEVYVKVKSLMENVEDGEIELFEEEPPFLEEHGRQMMDLWWFVYKSIEIHTRSKKEFMDRWTDRHSKSARVFVLFTGQFSENGYWKGKWFENYKNMSNCQRKLLFYLIWLIHQYFIFLHWLFCVI